MSTQKDVCLPPLSAFERFSASRGSPRQDRPASKFRTINAANTSSYLSTWPARVTSQSVQHQSQKYNSSGGNRHHGCGGPGAKPRFLEQLECYLERELTSLDMHSPKLQESKLQAYRDVFDIFIDSFKTYKPLLSAIKNEYDITLAYLQEQIRELEPLRAQLVLLSEQCEKRILALKEEERSEIRSLKQERYHLQKVIESMKEQQRDSEAQICQLQKDLAAQYLLYRDECDARKLLIANISNISHGSEEKPDDGQDDTLSEDSVTIKLALKVCREDLTRAQVELNHLYAEYADVVPRKDWESVDRLYRESLLKLETLQSDFDQMKSEYDTLLDVHSHVSMQKNNKVLREDLTPRPHWGLCTDVFGDKERWSNLSENQSSQKRLEILLEELSNMDFNQKDFFMGLGTSDEVPIYLRFEGQMKNLRLKKSDIVRTIKDIWREKASEDEKKEARSDLKDFLHKYLQRWHGQRAGEWAYSLLDGIKRNLKDDFISLFYDVLTGMVDEGLYHGQMDLLSHLLKVLIQSDSTESGSLSASNFSEALRKAFPLKSDQDIEELVEAAQSELEGSSGSIAYQRLYNEGTGGKHSQFLSLVKRQAVAERHHYISQLRAQLGDKREVGVEDLKTAFKTVDPTLDSETLDWNLQIAFTSKELHLETTLLDTESALQRLSVANVRRAGPVPQPQ